MSKSTGGFGPDWNTPRAAMTNLVALFVSTGGLITLAVVSRAHPNRNSSQSRLSMKPSVCQQLIRQESCKAQSSMNSMSKGTSDDALKLGVKGRLSNQEMEMLKQKLAQAVAYDHVPEQKLLERRAKPASMPMTRVYRKLEANEDRLKQHFRPSIKSQAAIEYEKKFAEGSYDSQRMRPPPKGITAAAKTILQDEYVTRPREVSVIPKNKHLADDQPEQPEVVKTGKKMAATAIPQVFIM